MSLLQFLIVALSVIALAKAKDGECSGQPAAARCTWGIRICRDFGSGATRSICVDGYCQCPDSDVYDPCTCLASVGPCTIELNAQNPVGTPTYEGDDVTIYSCAASTTCNYDVHVLSCHTALRYVHSGIGTVHMDISFVGQSSRPVVLVLLSYEAIQWTLNIQNNVVIDTVIVYGYAYFGYPNASQSDVSFSSGGVLSVERPSHGEIPHGYGPDIYRTGGPDTAELLLYLFNRFGHVSSFSGTHRADHWRVTINRQLEEACDLYTLPPTFSCPCSRPSTLSPPDPSACTYHTIYLCDGNSYCRVTLESGAVCVDGYCQCPRSNIHDSCSCLPSIGSCTVQRNAASPVGVPSISSVATGSSIDNTTYSCVSNANCKYDVHVLSCSDSLNFIPGPRYHGSSVGRSTVNISAIGQSPRPLVLVLVSSQPIAWELNIPSHVVIDLVFVINYRTAHQTLLYPGGGVTYPPGRVLSVNRTNYYDMPIIPRGYGKDSGGGDTVGLLQYLQDRFGDVASFSGVYGADGWRVDLILQEECSAPTSPLSLVCSAPTSLSPGAIGGIATAATIAFGAIVLFIVVYACYRSRKSRAPKARSAQELTNMRKMDTQSYIPLN